MGSSIYTQEGGPKYSMRIGERVTFFKVLCGHPQWGEGSSPMRTCVDRRGSKITLFVQTSSRMVRNSIFDCHLVDAAFQDRYIHGWWCAASSSCLLTPFFDSCLGDAASWDSNAPFVVCSVF